MCASVAVAMSGGVDSSVAAWLLREQGHDVLGITLEMFRREVPSTDVDDARAVVMAVFKMGTHGGTSSLIL